MLRTGTPRMVAGGDGAPSALPAGAWDRPPDQRRRPAAGAAGRDRPGRRAGRGLNPYRLFDDGYEGFLGLVAGQIAAGIANAQAYEEERKRAEALAEIDRAKTAFFSNVSHEFRTPLTLMLAPLEDALDDALGAALPPVQRERLDVAHRNGLRLLQLVNTLLDFSRIEAGRAQANFEPTDLAALTADLASGFRSAIERAGLFLTSTARRWPGRSMSIATCGRRSSSTCCPTPSSSPSRAASPSPSPRPTATVVALTVRDTGIGIPEHELPRLFERFHRIEDQRSRSFEGSGIGLALVQELVRLHGGTIEARSDTRQGHRIHRHDPVRHRPPVQTSGGETASRRSPPRPASRPSSRRPCTGCPRSKPAASPPLRR